MKKIRSLLEFQSNQVVLTHDDFYNYQLAFSNFQSKDEISKFKEKWNKLMLNNTFDELCRDIFYSYYNKNLEILSEDFIKLIFLINHKIISNLIKTETHIEQRKSSYSTIQDHDASFYAMYLAVVEISKKLEEYLGNSQKDIIEELDEQIDQHEVQNIDYKSKKNQVNKENLSKNEYVIRKKIKQYIEFNDNDIKKAVEDGINIAKNFNDEERKEVDKLFGGYHQGYEKGELVNIPIHQRIELAKKLRYVKELKKIVEFLGRFKLIAQEKQIDDPSNVRIGVTGYKKGDDLSKVYSSKMADISGDEISKLEFMIDWSEKVLPMINPPPLIKKKNISKGSIVICIDTSGSMSGIKDYKSKALALSVAEIAYQQKRNFACIIFSSSEDELCVIKIKPDETLDIISNNVIRIAQSFIGGGTDFELPLNEALSIINKDEFNNADILFLTDGFASISDSFLKDYKKIKEDKQIKSIGILLDATDYERDVGRRELEKFCDEVKYCSSIEKDIEFNNSDDIVGDIFSSLLF